MTTQATPDFNAMLADARKATETAQALATHWQAVADNQRDLIDILERARATLKRDLATIRDERDGLMSRLGEAIQGLMVGEGL